MKFLTNTKVIGGKKEGDLVQINVESAKGGNPQTVWIPEQFTFVANFLPLYHLI